MSHSNIPPDSTTRVRVLVCASVSWKLFAFASPAEEHHFVLVCPFVDLIKVEKCQWENNYFIQSISARYTTINKSG